MGSGHGRGDGDWADSLSGSGSLAGSEVFYSSLPLPVFQVGRRGDVPSQATGGQVLVEPARASDSVRSLALRHGHGHARAAGPGRV
eukprot:936051-Rhodomonas_salina.3